MLNYPNRIFFSRWEEQTEDNKWLYTSTYTLAAAARKFFRKTYGKKPDTLEWWSKWNVIELQDYDSPKVAFVEYEHFGVHPCPKELRRFVFYPNQCEIIELKILDPYILHRCHELIPTQGMGKQDPLKNPKDRTRWFSRCEELYRDFDVHNLVDHPQAHYESGWKQLLELKGLEVQNLPDEDHPLRMDKWIVQPVEVHAECSFGDL
jgi:hypothetical protein